jgi:solute carrier family 25 phosphate transporter 3
LESRKKANLLFFFLLYSELILKQMNVTKDQVAPSTMTTVNLSAGIVAGTVAAIVSQPADTLLSKINKQKGAAGESLTSRIITMAGQLGPKGLFLGLGPRIVMVATLTAGQL